MHWNNCLQLTLHWNTFQKHHTFKNHTKTRFFFLILFIRFNETQNAPKLDFRETKLTSPCNKILPWFKTVGCHWLQKPIFLVKHYKNTRTAFHRQCFRKQPANNSKVRHRFSLLLSKEQKTANVSTKHLRVVGRNLKNISKVQIHILVFLCTNLDYRDFKYQYLYRMGITAAWRTLLPSSISQSSHFQSVISGKKLNGMPCHCSADFWNWSICFFCLCNDYKTSYAGFL